MFVLEMTKQKTYGSKKISVNMIQNIIAQISSCPYIPRSHEKILHPWDEKKWAVTFLHYIAARVYGGGNWKQNINRLCGEIPTVKQFFRKFKQNWVLSSKYPPFFVPAFMAKFNMRRKKTSGHCCALYFCTYDLDK